MVALQQGHRKTDSKDIPQSLNDNTLILLVRTGSYSLLISQFFHTLQLSFLFH